jgi:hypothetical protein
VSRRVAEPSFLSHEPRSLEFSTPTPRGFPEQGVRDTSFFSDAVTGPNYPRGAYRLPAYFNLSLVTSGTCLAIWTYFHPEILSHAFNASIADVTQAHILATTIAVHAANVLLIGPQTHE